MSRSVKINVETDLQKNMNKISELKLKKQKSEKDNSG